MDQPCRMFFMAFVLAEKTAVAKATVERQAAEAADAARTAEEERSAAEAAEAARKAEEERRTAEKAEEERRAAEAAEAARKAEEERRTAEKAEEEERQAVEAAEAARKTKTEEKRAAEKAEEEERQADPTALKEKGDTHFKARRFSEARALYNKTLEAELSRDLAAGRAFASVLYCSRAACNLQLGDFTAALADAEEAGWLDGTNSKTYFRKGRALMSLRRFELAVHCLEPAVVRWPQDQDLFYLLAECFQRWDYDAPGPL